MRARTRVFTAALLAAVSVGLALSAHADEIDEIGIDLTGLPILPFGGEWIMVMPGEGEVTGGEIQLTFTTAGDFQAQNFVFELAGPTGGILLFGGRDLGWSGQGTFTANVLTDNFNGALFENGPSGFSWWFMNISPTASSLPTPVQGELGDSYFRFDYVCPPPCVADFDGSGQADSADFFAFIGAFLAGDADIDASGGTDSADFFAFIQAFLVGCEGDF